MVLASVWLTRGLHRDGVADLSDAVGPALDPERFWTILKDSRTGAFGVLGLILAVGGQWVACAGLIEARAFGALVFAPVLGRALGVVLGLLNRDLLKPGLGSFFLAAAPGRTLALVLGQTLVLGLVLGSLKGLATAIILAALGLFWLGAAGPAGRGHERRLPGSGHGLGRAVRPARRPGGSLTSLFFSCRSPEP